MSGLKFKGEKRPMMWFNNPALWWRDNQCIQYGKYLCCVGIGSRFMYGIWRGEFAPENRIVLKPCQDIEDGKRLIEEWLKNNTDYVELELCDECYTRHAPGGNDLCTK